MGVCVGNTRTPSPQTQALTSKLTCFFASTHLSKVLIISLARGERVWWGGGGGGRAEDEVVESPARFSCRLWTAAGAPPNAESSMSMGTTHAVCCNFGSKRANDARLSVSRLCFPPSFIHRGRFHTTFKARRDAQTGRDRPENKAFIHTVTPLHRDTLQWVNTLFFAPSWTRVNFRKAYKLRQKKPQKANKRFHFAQ